MLNSTALATPTLLRLSEVRASRMEVKFMCGRKAKVARRGIAACGRSFFRGDCQGSRQPGGRMASAMVGRSVNLLLSRNNFSRKDA
ncbi:hypothetical protein D3C72_1638620 [compost metagenome]